MSRYTGKVAWNGNHYYQGDEVSGSKIEWRGDELWLYDEEEFYRVGLGDFTRYEWVQIDPDSLQEKDKTSIEATDKLVDEDEN